MDKNIRYVEQIQTPIGLITVFATETHVTRITFEKGMSNSVYVEMKQVSPGQNHITALATDELRRYFQSTLQTFTVPVRLDGTPFQQAVWNTLYKLPFGQVCSYQECADQINARLAVRAVGAALGCNPIPIILPCHRVIGKSGKLTGYAGGLVTKAWLLRHEGH